MRSMVVVLAVLGFAATAAFPQDGGQLPVPGLADQKKAETDVRALFKETYAKKDRETKRDFAKKLLGQAPGTANGAEKFILLREARDLAAEGLDFETSFAAADALVKHFKIGEGSPLTGATWTATSNKLEALSIARKTGMTPDEAFLVAEQYVRLSEDAIQEVEYDAAAKAAQGAEQMAKAGNEAQLVKRAGEIQKEIVLLKAEDETSSKAAKAIGDGKSMPEHYAALGKFVLFAKNDDAGLKMLVQGNDPTLKAAAEKELAKAGPDSLLEIADVWWSAADRQKAAIDKKRCQRRAFVILEKAERTAEGLTKTKIQSRLDQMRPVVYPTGPEIDLLRLTTPKNAVDGQWQIAGMKLAAPKGGPQFPRIVVPYVPPREYTLTLVIEKREGEGHQLGIGLVAPGGGQFTACIDWGGACGIETVDGQTAMANETTKRVKIFTDTKPRTFVVTVLRGSLTVSVDGVKLVDWDKFSKARIGLSAYPVSNTKSLFLVASGLNVSKMTLSTISGEGQALR